MLFTHKLFFVAATRQSAANYILFSGGLPTRRYERFGQQKSPDSQGEGATKRLRASHFSQANGA